MGYVFTHIFECLLIAGLLGGVIGWLMRGSGFSQRLADLEGEWGRKLGLANDETSAALAKVKAAEVDGSGWKTKFVAMDGDFSKLKTSFSDVSAKVPALETAVAGWTAKAVTWDADKAKMQADLAACADARGKLELELKGWGTKSAAWDTQRADLTARLTAGAGMDGKVKDLTTKLAAAAGFEVMVSKLQGSQTAVEADKAALAAQLKKVQAEHDHAVNVYKLAMDNEKKLRIDAESNTKKIADLNAHLAKLQAEHDHAVNVYKLAIDNEKKLAATSAKVNPEHETLVATLRGQLSKLQAEHDHAVKVYKLAIANEKTLTTDHTTFLTKAHADYAELEGRFKALQAERAPVTSKDTSAHSQRDAVIAQLRSDTRILETKLHEMQLERDQALGRVNRSSADSASEHERLMTTVTELRSRLTSFEGERSNWATERTSWLAERSEWARKHAALEARLTEVVPAVKAAAGS